MATRGRKLLHQITFTPDHVLRAKLPLLHRSFLLPLLSFASSVYKLSLSSRKLFYQLGILQKQRLPVPVISVGNLTWGGNGKTPMVEFLALMFSQMGISPLILTRGYAGGDEVRMLGRHLSQSTARIGVGANRGATAAYFLERYGYVDLHRTFSVEKASTFGDIRNGPSEDIGIVIMDDGMQHWSLWRDLDIVMVNALMPWGNNHLIPRGPLREPLDALERADIAVIHHADLASDEQLKVIESTIQKVKEILPIYFSRLAPLHFVHSKDLHSKLPLSMVYNMVVVCVSAIGFPSAFIQVVEKMGPLHVDRVNFSDHHFIQVNEKLRSLQLEFGTEAVVVVTEKDYDRDPIILKMLDEFGKVLVLCSTLQIVPLMGSTEKSFKDVLKGLILSRLAK